LSGRRGGLAAIKENQTVRQSIRNFLRPKQKLCYDAQLRRQTLAGSCAKEQTRNEGDGPEIPGHDDCVPAPP
jgi:hypothetical protein